MIDRIVDAVRAAVLGHGFAWFDHGNRNLNLIGIRGASRQSGKPDDMLLCLYKEFGHWVMLAASLTVDPITKYLEGPINRLGAAILVSPQQVRGAYKVGFHRGRPALVQNRPFRVWRDDNRDAVLDWGEDEGIEGWYGINLHDGLSSAGCQAVPSTEALMAIRNLVEETGGVVSYTLLNSEDVGD